MPVVAFFMEKKCYHKFMQNGVNLYKNGVVNGVNHWERDIQRIMLFDEEERK